MEHPCVRGLTEWRPLARGGRSVVWAARQLTLDRPVAVKVYQRELDEAIEAVFCERLPPPDFQITLASLRPTTLASCRTTVPTSSWICARAGP